MRRFPVSSALFTSTLAIIGLIWLGYLDHDVAGYIAMIAIGHAGSRAWEGIKGPPPNNS